MRHDDDVRGLHAGLGCHSDGLHAGGRGSPREPRPARDRDAAQDSLLEPHLPQGTHQNHTVTRGYFSVFYCKLMIIIVVFFLRI